MTEKKTKKHILKIGENTIMEFKLLEPPDKPNRFYSYLFKIIGYDYNNLIQTYRKANTRKNTGVLDSEAKKINELLKEHNWEARPKSTKKSEKLELILVTNGIILNISYNSRFKEIRLD